MNKNDEGLEEIVKKRKAEERRLIEQLRWKRACVRLMPALPTEKEVQGKIKKFLELILTITRSNNLADKSAEIFGERLTLFAKREGTLYKCKVQNLQMKVQFVKERILSAMQGMAMCNETYGLLVLANVATEKSKERFYSQSHDDIPIEPAFVNEFVKKEIDFLDELQQRIDTELHESSQEIANEDHESIYESFLQTMVQLQNTMDHLDKSLNSQLQRQRETLEQLGYSIEAIQRDFEYLKSVTKGIDDEVDKGETNDETQSKQSEGEVLQDLWEVDNDESNTLPVQDEGEKHEEPKKGQCEDNPRQDDDAEGPKAEMTRKTEQRRRIIERMNKIRRTISDRRLPPARIFTARTQMRHGEAFLRCSFCNVKGLHYSDSCPEFKTVQERKKRVRCELCLDTKHRKERCKRIRQMCKYCNSRRHHTALCTLPQERGELELEFSELTRILQSIDESNGRLSKRERSTTWHDDEDRPSTSRRAEYH
uniref:CCHC-type domain-containing protein n=1 Tax=Haemonchus contortus TaxID=6289 RepID=A0A7I4Y810_HAECO|nr:hypothetical protein HCOI_00009700 [Haemonchus contortus]